jgi:hypothetical protein
VPITRKIAVTFDQAMDATSITTASFTVTGPGVTSVLGGVSYDAATHTATFTPAGPLAASTTFTATITTGAQSATLVPLASDFVWNFVSGADADTTAPTVIATNPADLAASVPTNQKIAASFSEPMDAATLSGASFTVTGPGLTPVAGTVAYSGVGALRGSRLPLLWRRACYLPQPSPAAPPTLQEIRSRLPSSGLSLPLWEPTPPRPRSRS